MSKLRKAAQGRECMVRIPYICNGDPATTVLAHYRLAGCSGMGLKPDDALGAWCCSACHDAVDGRSIAIHSKGAYFRDEVRLMHAEGVMRTFDALRREGLL